jgi:hypothetical protein
MFWFSIGLIVLVSLLILLKKNVLGSDRSRTFRYFINIYGAAFVFYVSIVALLLNPYNNKLYKDYQRMDWILSYLSNAVILIFLVGSIWLLIHYTRKWSKPKSEVPAANPVID